MTTWDDIRAEIKRGRAHQLAALVGELDEATRHTVAKELPGYLKELLSASNGGFWGDTGRGCAAAFRVVGAGCIPGATAVASWLCRRDLGFGSDKGHARLVVTAVQHRPPAWRADVARRVAARLRAADPWRDAGRWYVADLLAHDAGEGLPEDEAYFVGWVRWTTPYPDLNEEPYLDSLLPRLFEVQGAGLVLDPGTERDDPWIEMLLHLVAVHRIDRTMLLDGCVRRFLRGGTIQDLRWYVYLHDALTPSVPEAIDRARDYLRLLPVAPGRVAELALAELRRIDEAGALEEVTFREAAEALLFRPEKKLVRATLTWIDRTAAARVDASLTALTIAFEQDSLDLQERAARIVAKLAPQATASAREIVRNAAAGLPAEARERLAAAFGEISAPVSTTPGPGLPPPPAPAPRDLPPISSLPELTEEVAARLRGEIGWADGERVLAGIVEFAHRDPQATSEAMRRIAPHAAPWLLHDHDPLDQDPTSWLMAALRPLVQPTAGPPPFEHEPLSPDQAGPAPDVVLWTRMREICAAVGRTPALLSTPTLSTGHIDPAVLLERLERLEAAGISPAQSDLDQALMRLPREPGADIIRRARRLQSPAGALATAWLTGGGLPDPDVTCSFHSIPRKTWNYSAWERSYVDRVLPVIVAPDEGGLATPLLRYPAEGLWKVLDPEGFHISYAFSWWPSLLPSHREVIAAHLLLPLADRTESRDGQGAVLLALAEGEGPAGQAMATALALGLTAKRTEERAGATDAVITLCARRQLPATDLGTAIATLVDSGQAKLNRVSSALTETARAGAYADVLAVTAAALPTLLPAPGERSPTGLAELLALAAESAQNTGTRPEIKGLAGLATRGGSSRLVREAARLHNILTSA
ncbi:hypothetical protein J4573_39625 [Actinomadura barringtoniae]|uniref:Secreted protein n=1 Tax=Actinomadura barringtoniae TaxID=1427535 RepID=A0A939PIX9_9ACTN|nr:DUF6493 family protein [Actinomadura barringtoniae]MBO2453260.1 hypothetical protein [Actinomadura barringtoniae]